MDLASATDPVAAFPEDWQLVEVGSLHPFVTSGSRGWAAYYADHGSPFVRITNLTRESIRLDVADLRYVRLPKSAREGTRTELCEGDVLISITADIGIIGCVTPDLPTPAYINQHLALVRFDPSRADGQFVAHYLAADRAQDVFRALTDTGAKKGMSLLTIKALKIPLPPLPEQRAIATALTGIDRLVIARERLIEKKRSLRRAVAHQLLTGEVRLPGFDTVWTEMPFGRIATPSRLRVDPRQAASQICVELEHIAPGTGRLSGSTAAGEQASTKSVFHRDDVLFGRLRAYLRKYWLADCDGVCSTEIWVLVASRDVVTPPFLFQLVKRDAFIRAASSAYGTHMPRSDWNVVSAFRVAVPPLSEQRAITAVLSDMDAEIEAQEARLAKVRNLKKAMGQELLSGRTRLA